MSILCMIEYENRLLVEEPLWCQFVVQKGRHLKNKVIFLCLERKLFISFITFISGHLSIVKGQSSTERRQEFIEASCRIPGMR